MNFIQKQQRKTDKYVINVYFRLFIDPNKYGYIKLYIYKTLIKFSAVLLHCSIIISKYLFKRKKIGVKLARILLNYFHYFHHLKAITKQLMEQLSRINTIESLLIYKRIIRIY